jgi:hypothetical protein
VLVLFVDWVREYFEELAVSMWAADILRRASVSISVQR